MEFLANLSIGHVFLRTAAMFLIALLIVRLMGNRILGQMTPFDYVILVGIGDIVANVALDRDEKLLVGAEALTMLLILNFVLSYFSLKNTKFRHLIEGSPVQLIKDGNVIRENFSKAHFNTDDLRQEMHKLGMELDSIKDVKEAWLEGCGHFTVIKKQASEPVTEQNIQQIMNTGSLAETNRANISQKTLEELLHKLDTLTRTLQAQHVSSVGAPDVQSPDNQKKPGIH